MCENGRNQITYVMVISGNKILGVKRGDEIEIPSHIDLGKGREFIDTLERSLKLRVNFDKF